MAELAYAPVSKTGLCKEVWVQVPPPALILLSPSLSRDQRDTMIPPRRQGDGTIPLYHLRHEKVPEQFVQIPSVTQPALASFQSTRVLGSELDRPLSDSFVGHIHAALNEHFFDFPKAQTESKVGPDGVADDLLWKTMPKVAGSASFHPVSLPAEDLT